MPLVNKIIHNYRLKQKLETLKYLNISVENFQQNCRQLYPRNSK